MVAPSAGEVVLLPFPFSGLSWPKVRLAVCLADAGRGDRILCQITSRPFGDPFVGALDVADFAAGGHSVACFARPGKLFTAVISLLARQSGTLTPAAFARVLSAVVAIFRPPAGP